MAPSTAARCRDVRRTICAITKAVSAYAHTPISRPFLLSQIPYLRACHAALHVPLEMLEPFMMKGEDLAQEHSIFIGSFADLLTALLPQIERVGIALSARRTEALRNMMECLWLLLYDCCWAYSNWPDTIPERSELDTTRLHSACAKLMAWVVQFTHSPVIWDAVTGIDVRAYTLAVVVRAPLKCFVIIGLLPPSALFNRMCSLAPDFVSNLCCIVSEQLCKFVPIQSMEGANPPPGPNHTHSRHGVLQGQCPMPIGVLVTTQIFYPLLRSIYMCVNASDALSSRRLDPVMAAPAIAHLLKMLVISHPPTEPLAGSDMESLEIFNAMALTCLLTLEQCVPVSEHLSVHLAVLQEVGLGVPSNASCPSQIASIRADRQLLHMLLSRKARDALFHVVQNKVMMLIMQAWLVREGAGESPAQSQAWLTRVVCGLGRIALQCMSHSLRWMQNMCTERQARLVPSVTVDSDQVAQHSFGWQQQTPSHDEAHGPSQDVLVCTRTLMGQVMKLSRAYTEVTGRLD